MSDIIMYLSLQSHTCSMVSLQYDLYILSLLLLKEIIILLMVFENFLGETVKIATYHRWKHLH